MKIYLAGRFSRRHELQAWGDALVADGHEIVSRWSLRGSDHQIPQGQSEQAADHERERFAREDVEDIDQADCIVSMMEEPRGNGRGGRHIEFGYALAKGLRLVCIGPRETVFHHLPAVEHFDEFEPARAALRVATSGEGQGDA